MHARPESRCSQRSSIVFHWFDGLDHSGQDPLEVAADEFMSALKGPGRLWNPYAEAMTRSEFKKRVNKASRGELKPVEEVKGVDEERPAPLYEIRWQGITVHERGESDSPDRYMDVAVRMYHSEPTVVPDYFIGHHIHEKEVSDDVNIVAAQDAEISKARNLFYLGEAKQWFLEQALQEDR